MRPRVCWIESRVLNLLRPRLALAEHSATRADSFPTLSDPGIALIPVSRKGAARIEHDFLMCAVSLRRDFAILTADNDFVGFSRVLGIDLHALFGPGPGGRAGPIGRPNDSGLAEKRLRLRFRTATRVPFASAAI